MAIRIEDTSHITITMNQQPFVVGAFASNLRIRLMRQHLADVTADVTDMLDDRVYNDLWRKIADVNSTVYDMLDGDTSMYRCTRIADFNTALARFQIWMSFV